MNEVRTAKVATVDELKAKVDSTSTAVVTEYRGMTVAQISTLRRQLRTLDADYKVFKNTLVRRAIAGTSVESLDEFLVGPTAIAFVNGDVSAVAKALRDFAKATPSLVVKGGVLDGKALSLKDLTALADLPSRDVLLARFAGLLASPLRRWPVSSRPSRKTSPTASPPSSTRRAARPLPRRVWTARSPRLRPGSRTLVRQRATTTRHPSPTSRTRPRWPSPTLRYPRRRVTSQPNRPNRSTQSKYRKESSWHQP